MYFGTLIIFAVALSAAAQQPPAPPPLPEMKLEVLNAGSPPAPKLPPDTIVITVGDEKISLAEFERILDSLPEPLRTNARGPDRRQFGETLVRMKLLAREALKDKLDETPEYRTQLEFQRQNVLANLKFEKLLAAAKPAEADLRTYYEQYKKEWERVHARHILVRARGSRVPLRPGQKDLSDQEALAKARELRKKLLDGADFAALSAAESDDVSSGAKGGDLGFFGHGQMAPAFDQAAFMLAVGQISEPVRTPFGYHIIKVESKDYKSFEEVRPEIEKRLRPREVQKVVQELQRNAEVTLNSAYFGN